MTDRGQTLYDFLLGTTLLLVTIVLVLSLFDPLFSPFTSPSGADNDEMADRLTDRIVAENATVFGDRVLELDEDSLDDSYLDSLRARTGIPSFRNLNVTLETGGEIVERNGIPVSGGSTRVDDPVAAATRVVTLPPGSGHCQTGCFLRVEVW